MKREGLSGFQKHKEHCMAVKGIKPGPNEDEINELSRVQTLALVWPRTLMRSRLHSSTLARSHRI